MKFDLCQVCCQKAISVAQPRGDGNTNQDKGNSDREENYFHTFSTDKNIRLRQSHWKPYL